jgi:hypothetical protein
MRGSNASKQFFWPDAKNVFMNPDTVVKVGVTPPIATDDDNAASRPHAHKRQCSSPSHEGGTQPTSTKRRCESRPPRLYARGEHDIASIAGDFAAAADDDDDDDDDMSSFELDLSTCPEVGGIGVGMSKLRIANPPVEEGEGRGGDDDQNLAIECAANGGNLFLTGKAGTGKSWTSRQIRARLVGKRLWVVAPTGVAAINVDGMTVHAWGGFGENRFFCSGADIFFLADAHNKHPDTCHTYRYWIALQRLR